MLYKLASLSLAKPQKPEKFKESGASRPSVVRPQSNQSDHSQLCPLKQKHWDMRYQLHTHTLKHTHSWNNSAGEAPTRSPKVTARQKRLNTVMLLIYDRPPAVENTQRFAVLYRQW